MANKPNPVRAAGSSTPKRPAASAGKKSDDWTSKASLAVPGATVINKSPRPMPNPKRGMTSSPRPKANPFIPKAIEDRSARAMAKGGMCRGMGAAKKGGGYMKNG